MLHADGAPTYLCLSRAPHGIMTKKKVGVFERETGCACAEHCFAFSSAAETCTAVTN